MSAIFDFILELLGSILFEFRLVRWISCVGIIIAIAVFDGFQSAGGWIGAGFVALVLVITEIFAPKDGK